MSRPKPLTDQELDELYRDDLDEVYGAVKIAGLVYDTSHALKEIDPTAYRCGFSDWLDAQVSNGELFESDGLYYADDPSDLADGEGSGEL